MKDFHNPSILDVFSIVNLDNIPTNTTSRELCVWQQWNKCSAKSFFAKQKENKGTFIEEWDWESFKFDLLSMRQKGQSERKLVKK